MTDMMNSGNALGIITTTRENCTANSSNRISFRRGASDDILLKYGESGDTTFFFT
jgi:hypothetical protein